MSLDIKRWLHPDGSVRVTISLDGAADLGLSKTLSEDAFVGLLASAGIIADPQPAPEVWEKETMRCQACGGTGETLGSDHRPETCSACHGARTVLRPGSEHVTFPIVTQEGHAAHVIGDPQMSDATRQALGHMVDLLYKQFETGFGEWWVRVGAALANELHPADYNAAFKLAGAAYQACLTDHLRGETK